MGSRLRASSARRGGRGADRHVVNSACAYAPAMPTDRDSLCILLLTLAGWISRQQQDVIDYLVEENRTLREQLLGRRPQLSHDQRRRLAVKGKRLGRELLERVATIVTPDTILRWRRMLIARKWTCARLSESAAPA